MEGWGQLIIQMGVAGFSLWILYQSNQTHARQLDEREKAYRDFVQNNNHKVTSLVTESTLAIQESSRVMKESGDFIRKATDTMTGLREDIRDQMRNPR